jgi:2-oxoglutarate ferredoxin oxidoreductase subunit alpha
VANGSEHDAIGDTTHLPQRHVQMTERRFGKLALLHECDFECENPDAPVAVVPWGGSKGPALEAFRHLIKDGLNLGWLYTMFLHPLPPHMLEQLRSKELVLVPELNYQGQFSSILRSHGVNAESITQYTGLPFKVSDLKREIRERMMSVTREEVMA